MAVKDWTIDKNSNGNNDVQGWVLQSNTSGGYRKYSREDVIYVISGQIIIANALAKRLNYPEWVLVYTKPGQIGIARAETKYNAFKVGSYGRSKAGEFEESNSYAIYSVKLIRSLNLAIPDRTVMYKATFQGGMIVVDITKPEIM